MERVQIAYGTGRIFVTYLLFLETDVEENGHFGWVCIVLFGLSFSEK